MLPDTLSFQNGFLTFGLRVGSFLSRLLFHYLWNVKGLPVSSIASFDMKNISPPLTISLLLHLL